MKIFSSKQSPRYVLDIIFQVDESAQNDAIAAVTIVHPKNVKKKFLISDDQLADYNALIDTIISIVQYYRFDVIEEKQSKGSYSYYIDLFPTDEHGNRWDESIRIKFRFSNHPNSGADNQSVNRTNHSRLDNVAPDVLTYIKPFVVGGSRYPDNRHVISDVKAICGRLKQGDYSDFIA